MSEPHDTKGIAVTNELRPIERLDQAKIEEMVSTLSKAAEAAIDVLADDGIPADKRVAIALNILVKFFEEAAAA